MNVWLLACLLAKACSYVCAACALACSEHWTYDEAETRRHAEMSSQVKNAETDDEAPSHMFYGSGTLTGCFVLIAGRQPLNKVKKHASYTLLYSPHSLTTLEQKQREEKGKVGWCLLNRLLESHGRSCSKFNRLAFDRRCYRAFANLAIRCY